MMMDNNPNVLKTGTSTLGITFKGGVVVGADHRATMGTLSLTSQSKTVSNR